MFVVTPKGQVYFDYYTTNPVSKRTAVYIHGLGGDCKAWEFMKQSTLDAGYNFLAIDLPGHGESYRPDINFSFQEFIDNVEKIMKDVGINSPLLVGHCLGGLIALEYAIDRKKEIRGLILINSSYRATTVIKLSRFLKSLARLLPTKHKKGYIDHNLYIGTGDINLKRFISDISHVGLQSYLLMLISLCDYNHEQDLKSIRTPSLIIGGLQDTIFPLAHQKYMAKYIPGAHFIQIDTNHVSVLNSRDKIMEIISKGLITL